MTSLVTDLESAAFNCGYETARWAGPVKVTYPSDALVKRLALLREIDRLEKLANLWRTERTTETL